MGGRSSPGIFDKLPEALEWIIVINYSIERFFHLLDDFLAVEPESKKGEALECILKVFEILGIQ